MATSWYLAKSLATLRDQVNAQAPHRNKRSDGTIGDAAHAAGVSDHNPNSNGAVTAMDITHDPAGGMDVQKLADALADSRDSRIKYLIFNDHIMVPSDYGWRWVYHYAGSHRSHLHVSVWGDYDNTKQWNTGANMPVKIDKNTARIIAYAFWGSDGRDGRINSRNGQRDADLEKHHIGGDLTNDLIVRAFDAAEATNYRKILDSTYAERNNLRVQVAELNKQLDDARKAAATAKQEAEAAKQEATRVVAENVARDPFIPASTSAPATTEQEPIDNKNVNWLVRILINLFGNKQS